MAACGGLISLTQTTHVPLSPETTLYMVYCFLSFVNFKPHVLSLCKSDCLPFGFLAVLPLFNPENLTP